MFFLRGFSVFLSGVVFLVIKSGHGAEIINGREVPPHSLPFMALLETKQPACGGILINPKWVLTAAHCVGMKKVLLGVHSIKGKEKDSRQDRRVKKSVTHPCYDKDERVNDLQLLKLDKPVKKTKAVEWLQLREAGDPAAGSSCLVAGWGKTKNNAKTLSDVLMSVNVSVVDRVKCNSAEYYNLSPVITKGMICAGSPDGKTAADSCQGDSGGPLLCNGVLVGVTSWGRNCGLIKKPGVYSFLSGKQLEWIKNTIKKSEMEQILFK